MPQSSSTADKHLETVLRPILYADIFDCPLTFDEIYRFLERKATPAQVSDWLTTAVDNQTLTHQSGFFTLPHRTALITSRHKRQAAARQLWPVALRYSRRIAALPFVTMVAVTGSLAVDNPRNGVDDIDFLVVTRPGRLWLSRALLVLLVRYGHQRGVQLCPNYIITENALDFENNLFVAREIIQMRPLYGRQPYHRICQKNGWVSDYFPHGAPPSPHTVDDRLPLRHRLLKRLGQLAFINPLGNWLERHLQQYQVNKHAKKAADQNKADTLIFSPDVCKGHYHGHGNNTLAAYRHRLQRYLPTEPGITLSAHSRSTSAPSPAATLSIPSSPSTHDAAFAGESI